MSPLVIGGGFTEAFVDGKTESITNSGMFGFVPMGGVIGVALSFGVASGLNQLLNKLLEDNGVSARNVVSVPMGPALPVALTESG